MSNILDYIHWRGDLGFRETGFNEVDNVILSELSYLDFSDIVSDDEPIELHKAVSLYMEQLDESKIKDKFHIKTAVKIIKNILPAKRFCDIMLSNYKEQVNESEDVQFSAIRMDLDDGSVFISFSGTDDSIVGWKENFMMTYLQNTSGQKLAVDYLNAAIRDDDKIIRMGGHSKGGNLSVYAGIHCRDDIRDRIRNIYSNDGPGFIAEMVDEDIYRKLLPKIVTIIPEGSVVGLLLEHMEDQEVIKSSKKGYVQHDAINWMVDRTEFIRVDGISNAASILNDIIMNWLDRLDMQQRLDLVDTVFGIMQEHDIHTVAELKRIKPSTIVEIIKNTDSMDEGSRELIAESIKHLWKEGNQGLRNGIKQAFTDIKNKLVRA